MLPYDHLTLTVKKKKYDIFYRSSLYLCDVYIWTCSFFITIYFIRISSLKFAKFLGCFKNKQEAEILNRTILCVENL